MGPFLMACTRYLRLCITIPSIKLAGVTLRVRDAVHAVEHAVAHFKNANRTLHVAV